MSIKSFYLFIFIPLSILPISPAHAAYEYLINSANRIYEITATHDEKNTINAVSLACKAITHLLKDKKFTYDLKRMESMNDSYFKERQKLAGDLRVFLRNFSAIEAEALNKAGVSDGLRNELLMSIGSVYGSINEYRFNSKEVQLTLNQFKQHTCQIRNEMTNAVAVREKQVQLKRIFVRIGGLVIFAANIPLVVANPPAAYISGSSGIALASGAVDVFINE